MSGTARPGRLELTKPFWYAGRLNSDEEPPPPPDGNAGVLQDLPLVLNVALRVPQPVSKTNLPSAPIASEEPPTAVIAGSEADESVCSRPVLATSSPLSPDEKSIEMHCMPACRNSRWPA